jgi:hypothetical protein
MFIDKFSRKILIPSFLLPLQRALQQHPINPSPSNTAYSLLSFQKINNHTFFCLVNLFERFESIIQVTLELLQIGTAEFVATHFGDLPETLDSETQNEGVLVFQHFRFQVRLVTTAQLN